jgi:hypothetical protein
MEKDETIYDVLAKMGAFFKGDRTPFVDPLVGYLERLGLTKEELADFVKRNPEIISLMHGRHL